MATTCKLIAKVSLGSAASVIEFTSIPGTGYTDLLIVMSVRSARSATSDDMLLKFNGSTSNFSARYLYGTGTATGSGTYARYVGPTSADTATADTFGTTEVYIPNYAGSTNKSYSVTTLGETNSASANAANINVTAGLWSDTSAITSVSFDSLTSSNFKAGSTAYLYGITKA